MSSWGLMPLIGETSASRCHDPRRSISVVAPMSCEGDALIALRVSDGPLKVLCLGAHPDDIEIGCGGALLRLAPAGRTLGAPGVVLTGDEERAGEARAALDRFVPGAKVEAFGLPDGRLPAHWEEAKQALEDVRRADRSRPGLRAARRRRPPGPPVGRLAGHDGLARRPGAALRDPQVGRRPRRAEPLRGPDRRGSRGARSPCSTRASRPSPAATGGTTSCSSG